MANGVRAALQPYVGNTLPASVDDAEFVCAIVGDAPSKSARSPVLWNAAFHELGWKAVFVPLDVQAKDLPSMVKVAREVPALKGFAATMPYKVDLIPLLDEVEPAARGIGAVNAVANRGGRLVGTNTDGAGFLLGAKHLLPEPRGKRALVLGAGGAARAIAFHLAQAGAHVSIANRTEAAATRLAADLSRAYGAAAAVPESSLDQGLRAADVVVNATTCGQMGLRRKGAEGLFMEPYSPLAPASPPLVAAPPGADEPALFLEWMRAARPDIETNHRISLARAALIPRSSLVLDAVFAPPEATFLRHARWTGHRTLNGRPMNLYQAVDAFVRHVLPDECARAGMTPAEAHDRLFRIMSAVP